MKKIFLLFIVLFAFTSINYAQEYEIKLKINGVRDTVAYLGHHFGAQKYVVDTAKIDHNGNVVFVGNKKLYRGIYIVVLPSRAMTYFEIILGNDGYKFSIETDTADFVAKMKIKGSNENVVFNEYQKKMSEMGKTITKLNKEYEIANQNKADVSEIRQKMVDWQNERETYIQKLINDHPKYFFSTVLKSMIDIKIPDAPKDEKGEIIDPAFGYHYNKAHFWDNMNFSEVGMLRTPIYESKLDYFISKMIPPLPDSLIVDCNKIIRKAYDEGDSLMFQYTCSHIFNMFDTSRIMGYDAVMVSIAEEWYLSGKATWVDTAFLKKAAERVEKITPTKIGNIAYNLVRMQSFDDKYYTLHDIKADYMVVIFYEPSCGHCKKEIPLLISAYNDTLKAMGVKVFAMYNQYDKPEWVEFIEKNSMNIDGWYNVWDGPRPHTNYRNYYDIYSTPTLFLLDKDKKIIAKRISVENIKEFLLQHELRLEYEKGLKK
ncbi:MAG: DUF5106 domain-containing protein [Bacteroidales bacterium]|jgi:thiol-disulfide isomerase/thioredoxin|nr:DUF5106 domain-containing protein [Bacteroidales bacterium]